MPTIETKLGPIDLRLLDLRGSPIDDEKRFGVRIEVWPKPADELLQMSWELGDEIHPNCGRGQAVSTHCLNDTVDPDTGTLGAGTMIVMREEAHPPNCMLTKVLREYGGPTALRSKDLSPLAVYEQVQWEKVNPFEATPDEVDADFGDGKTVKVASSTLTKRVSLVENESEYTHAVEYRDATGRIVQRSVDVKLKKSAVAASGAAAGF